MLIKREALEHMTAEDREFWERMIALDDAVAQEGGQYVITPNLDDPAEKARFEEDNRMMTAWIENEKAKETLKCICGSVAKVQYRDMPVRVNGKMVTVKNSPGYVCSECGEGMTKGSDSLRMTDRAKIAFENNWAEIEF
jgi:YgiT-type zinc finger domain-containing protein